MPQSAFALYIIEEPGFYLLYGQGIKENLKWPFFTERYKYLFLNQLEYVFMETINSYLEKNKTKQNNLMSL